MMRALIKHASGVEIQEVPKPQPTPNQIIMRVQYVGVCRTDVYVARDLIKTKQPLTLGHECAGHVYQIGTDVQHFEIGQPISAMPIMSCTYCPACLQADPLVCHKPRMLGMDVHGAFAQYVAIDAHEVYKVPDTMDLKLAAYLEPIAASMAILRAPISPEMKGLIYGNNRIAKLTQIILSHHGFEHVVCHDAKQDASILTDHAFDFCVETLATTKTMDTLMRVIKPRGTLILKSRPAQSVGLNFRRALQKELTLMATQYAPFSQAIEFATKHPQAFVQLLGDVFALDDFEEVFEKGGLQGTKKSFFNPWI